MASFDLESYDAPREFDRAPAQRPYGASLFEPAARMRPYPAAPAFDDPAHSDSFGPAHTDSFGPAHTDPFGVAALADPMPAEQYLPAPRRRAAVKPPSVRGGTVVGATAALGAVVTGSFMAGAPGLTPGATADAAAAMIPAAHLASATEPLRTRTAASHTSAADPVSSTALLPVAVPGDRVAAADQRDVEALHKGETLAAEAVAQHAAAVKLANVLGGGGNLDDWINVALDQMGMSQSLSGGIRRVIMAESRGNPHAVNRTDSNAMAGRPSQGLMQVIPSTFRAYVLPSLAHRPITDPVANITAGVRYMLANYGLGTLRQGGNRDRSGNYLPY